MRKHLVSVSWSSVELSFENKINITKINENKITIIT